MTATQPNPKAKAVQVAVAQFWRDQVLGSNTEQDNGLNKNNLDLILHGPVVGLSFRW